jgi:hypothetical protein
MKSIKISCLIILCGLLTSCCQQRFLKHFELVSVVSDEVILEARGDTVPFTIIIKAPSGVVCNDITLYFTPCLKQDTLRTIWKTFTVSRNARSHPDYVFDRKKEKLVVVQGYFMNFPQFQDSYFMVEWHAETAGKTAPMSDRLLGYGISQIYHYSNGLETGFDPVQVRQQLEMITDKNAGVYYMTAVMCARLFDEAGVLQNLKTAIAMEPALKKRLQHDVEFIGYRKTDWFPGLAGA